MFLIDEDAEVQNANEVESDTSDSEIEIQAVRRRCFCIRKSVKISWDKIPN